MRRYRVVITPFAGENIREAHGWLEAENPVYAAKWLSGIRDKILELQTLPESHPVAPKASLSIATSGSCCSGEEHRGEYSSPSKARRSTCSMSATALEIIGGHDIGSVM